MTPALRLTLVAVACDPAHVGSNVLAFHNIGAEARRQDTRGA